jgi:hypothetical protein
VNVASIDVSLLQLTPSVSPASIVAKAVAPNIFSATGLNAFLSMLNSMVETNQAIPVDAAARLEPAPKRVTTKVVKEKTEGLNETNVPSSTESTEKDKGTRSDNRPAEQPKPIVVLAQPVDRPAPAAMLLPSIFLTAVARPSEQAASNGSETKSARPGGNAVNIPAAPLLASEQAPAQFNHQIAFALLLTKKAPDASSATPQAEATPAKMPRTQQPTQLADIACWTDSARNERHSAKEHSSERDLNWA